MPSLTYKEAGVSIAANTRWVDAIRACMTATYDPRVMNRHNAFAGLYRLDYDEQLFRRNYRKPVLVACADGVGTKVLLALQLGKLSTLGIDLVAMNVNDLITCGAEPLFFLDYLAVHELSPPRLLTLIEGVAEGCRQAGCALLGGETAEMPDVYRRGDIDLAGFAVGVVEFDRVIDGRRIEVGDVLIGLPSSGIHSNGYTLVRKLIEKARCDLSAPLEGGTGTIGEALLAPTRIYVRAVSAVLEAFGRRRVVSAMAHITGGGLRENIARLLPGKVSAVISRRAWRPPPVFDFLRRLGVARGEMFKVFNMGIGYVFVVRPRNAQGVLRALRGVGEDPVILGRIVTGNGRVVLEG